MRRFLVALAVLSAGCIGDSERLFWDGDADATSPVERVGARPGARTEPEPQPEPALTIPVGRPVADEPPAAVDATTPHVVSIGGNPTALSCDEFGAYWVDAESGDVMRMHAGEAPALVTPDAALGAVDSAPVGVNLYVATAEKILRVNMRTGSSIEFAATPGLHAFRFHGGMYWSDDRGVLGPHGRIVETDGAPIFALDDSGLYVVDPSDGALRRYMFSGEEQAELADATGIRGPSALAIDWPRAFWGSEGGLRYAADGGVGGQLGGPADRVAVDSGRVIRADGGKILALNEATMVDVGVWSGYHVTGLAACSGNLYWITTASEVWTAPLPQ